MGMDKDDLISFLHGLLEQKRLIIELCKEGLIEPGIRDHWLDAQWSVMLELHKKLKEGD